MDKQERASVEEIRVDALSRGDALIYTSLCDELRVEPENKELYEQGALNIAAILGQSDILQDITRRPW